MLLFQKIVAGTACSDERHDHADEEAARFAATLRRAAAGGRVFHLRDKLGVGSETLGGIRCEHLANDARGFARDLGRERAHVGRRVLQAAQLARGGGFTLDWRTAGEGVEEGGAEAEDVAPEILGRVV